jgi:hypothetical protein
MVFGLTVPEGGLSAAGFGGSAAFGGPATATAI